MESSVISAPIDPIASFNRVCEICVEGKIDTISIVLPLNNVH